MQKYKYFVRFIILVLLSILFLITASISLLDPATTVVFIKIHTLFSQMNPTIRTVVLFFGNIFFTVAAIFFAVCCWKKYNNSLYNNKSETMGEDILTKEEENYLLKEYKIGMDAYYRSETIYASRENFFFVAMGIIVAAAIELIKPNTGNCVFNESYMYVFGLVILIGFFLSLIWLFMQEKSSYLAYKRLRRLKDIEKRLPPPSYKKDKSVFKFFTETADENAAEDIQYKSRYKISTWILRKLIPGLLLVFWIILSIQFHISLLPFFIILIIFFIASFYIE